MRVVHLMQCNHGSGSQGKQQTVSQQCVSLIQFQYSRLLPFHGRISKECHTQTMKGALHRLSLREATMANRREQQSSSLYLLLCLGNRLARCCANILLPDGKHRSPPFLPRKPMLHCAWKLRIAIAQLDSFHPSPLLPESHMSNTKDQRNVAKQKGSCCCDDIDTDGPQTKSFMCWSSSGSQLSPVGILRRGDDESRLHRK
jgi:hypothetical protein